MPYWFKPAVTEALQKVYDGTNWVNQLGDSSGQIKAITVENLGIFSTKQASTTVAAADNTSGVELSLDTEGRKLIHWHVELGGAGDAKIQVSSDGSTWYDTPNSTSLSAAGYWDDWDFIGFRYVKVVVPTTGIDVTILISAKA